MRAAFLIRCSTKKQDYERQVNDLTRLLLSAKMVTTTVAKQHIITNQKKSVYPIASWIYPANIPGIIMLSAMNAVQMA